MAAESMKEIHTMNALSMYRLRLAFACLAALGALSFGTAQAQDAQKGQKVFAQCAACHATDGHNGVGPSLKGIIGRKAGTAPGFHYSHAMKRFGKTWDASLLNTYVANPQALVPGNVMPFSGLPGAEDRADLVAYLATLK